MLAKARLVTAAVAALWINGASADGSGTGPNSWIGYVFGGNLATAPSSAVAAGSNNVASGAGAFVGAGVANQANGLSSLVIGGFDNRATVIDATVVSGAGNRATGARSVIVGGGYNLASGHWSFIGGGGRSGTASTPAGTNASDNIAAGFFSTIGGGEGNRASEAYSMVGGGSSNTAGSYGTVAGGSDNTATGPASTVGGGANNIASGVSSTVAGGYGNVAMGDVSFAAGFRAKANEAGMFVWADGRSFDFSPTTFRAPDQSENTFNVRATGVGGVFFATGINASTGVPSWACYAQNGGGWTCTSDRRVKRNLELLDGQAVLSQVAALPVYRWQAKDGPRAELQHIGPMAQDFYAAFGLGDSDKAIGLLDASGVAMAAIQGLHQLGQEKDAQIAALQARGDRQQLEMAELRRAVEVLLARSSLDAQVAQR